MKFIFMCIVTLFLVSCSYISIIPSDSGLKTNSTRKAFCWESFPIRVWYDKDLDKETILQANRAINYINSEIGTEVFSKPLEWLEFAFPDKAPKGMVLLGKGYGVKGATIATARNTYNNKKAKFVSSVIFLYGDYKTPEKSFVTLVHEFGHVLGLKHDYDIFSIMHSNLYSAPLEKKRLTKQDIKLLKKYYL